MAMVVECVDDLVSPGHPARQVMAVIEGLDLSDFDEAIKAREHQAGGDATDPALLVALWLYVCTRGVSSARAGAALQGERGLPLAVRRSDGEPPSVVGIDSFLFVQLTSVIQIEWTTY